MSLNYANGPSNRDVLVKASSSRATRCDKVESLHKYHLTQWLVRVDGAMPMKTSMHLSL